MHSPPTESTIKLRGNFTTISELAGEFAKFRREHPRFTRIPLELRSAAVAALDSGVSAYRIHQLCGVGANQLKSWKAASEPAPRLRVFPVMDEPPSTEGTALELRLGPWSISVRLIDATGERG